MLLLLLLLLLLKLLKLLLRLLLLLLLRGVGTDRAPWGLLVSSEVVGRRAPTSAIHRTVVFAASSPPTKQNPAEVLHSTSAADCFGSVPPRRH